MPGAQGDIPEPLRPGEGRDRNRRKALVAQRAYPEGYSVIEVMREARSLCFDAPPNLSIGMQLSFGLMNAEFVVCQNDEAPHPFLDIFRLEKLNDLIEKCFSSRSAKPNKYDSMMQAGLKTSIIRKIQILRNQKTPFILRGSPYRFVSRATKTFGIKLPMALSAADNRAGMFSSSLILMQPSEFPGPADLLRRMPQQMQSPPSPVPRSAPENHLKFLLCLPPPPDWLELFEL